jgi:hypothetical protein
MKLFGDNFNRRELARYVGNPLQVVGISRYVYDEGKEKGVLAYDVRTGGGFRYTVLPSRGMDISAAEYKGTPLCFLSKTGIVHPMYFDDRVYGYKRSFFAGLLSTCGLTYMGEPCTDQGEDLGKHGRINNIPAETSRALTRWEDDELTLSVDGVVRESAISGENMQMERDIVSKAGENGFTISDVVTNCGFAPAPVMMLYHFNLGFPLLSKDTKVYMPERITTPYNEESARYMDKCLSFSEPDIHNHDLVYYHDLKPDSGGYISSCLFNPELNESGTGIMIRWCKNQLPVLVQWKSMKDGDYVVGLEPSNACVDGRAAVRERNELDFLEPWASRDFGIEFAVVDGKDDFRIMADKYSWVV